MFARGETNSLPRANPRDACGFPHEVGDQQGQSVHVTTTPYMLDLGLAKLQVVPDGIYMYLYGAGRLAQYQTDMQYFPGTARRGRCGADALGSVRQIYDASGQVAADARYDPYGNLLAQSGAATSVYGFAGEQTDETG